MHMSKLIRLYTFNTCSLFYITCMSLSCKKRKKPNCEGKEIDGVESIFLLIAGGLCKNFAILGDRREFFRIAKVRTLFGSGLSHKAKWVSQEITEMRPPGSTKPTGPGRNCLIPQEQFLSKQNSIDSLDQSKRVPRTGSPDQHMHIGVSERIIDPSLEELTRRGKKTMFSPSGSS